MPRVSEDIYKSRVAAQMLHGGGSRLNSGNRWFDKTLQVRADALKVLKRWLWKCFLRIQKSKKSQQPFAGKVLMSRVEKQGRQGVVSDSVRSCGSPCSHQHSLLPQGLVSFLPLPKFIQCSRSLCSLQINFLPAVNNASSARRQPKRWEVCSLDLLQACHFSWFCQKLPNGILFCFLKHELPSHSIPLISSPFSLVKILQ